MYKIKDAICDLPALRGLFIKYYSELDCEDDPQYLFDGFIARDLKADVLGAALIYGDDLPAAEERPGEADGFVIFQIDDMINDWCFKEGWGDVREIYVDAACRRHGLGRALLEFAEAKLKEAGAADIYLLPTDESEGFFIACGYEEMGEYCADLDCKVFSLTPGKRI